MLTQESEFEVKMTLRDWTLIKIAMSDAAKAQNDMGLDRSSKVTKNLLSELESLLPSNYNITG
jgi:hypothetical protein